MVRLKVREDIDRLRDSGRILASVLAAIHDAIAVGVPLETLDRLAAGLIKKAGASAAFLGYRAEGSSRPYPASICVSVNDQVVHGRPSSYALREGDIVSVDIGVNYRGYVTDAAITVGVGEITAMARNLLSVTSRALDEAVKICLPGCHLGDIGWTIQRIAERAHFSVVRGLTGHGVGFALHEEPVVYNFGRAGEGMPLVSGLVLAIEPMIATGTPEVFEDKDGSFRTRDGGIAAHFEHTVAVTDEGEGPVVLTVPSL